MTYSKPQVVVLGEAVQLIQGTQKFGPGDACSVLREFSQAEENED
jgi:hypothetical protein